MKKIISTNKSPAPIGAYNQATLVNNMLFVSGQIAIHPLSGELRLKNISMETQQIMENLKGILEKANMTFDNIVKASIFLTDIDNFSKVDTIYGSYFNRETAPAREAIQVACLPKRVNVEISVIAVK